MPRNQRELTELFGQVRDNFGNYNTPQFITIRIPYHTLVQSTLPQPVPHPVLVQSPVPYHALVQSPVSQPALMQATVAQSASAEPSSSPLSSHAASLYQPPSPGPTSHAPQQARPSPSINTPIRIQWRATNTAPTTYDPNIIRLSKRPLEQATPFDGGFSTRVMTRSWARKMATLRTMFVNHWPRYPPGALPTPDQ